MQLLDGFIVGIYNYCDRWCETCPFTSRCRVFATSAELHASLDPQFQVIGAGLLRSTAAMQANLMAAEVVDTASREIDGQDDEDDDEDVVHPRSPATPDDEDEAGHVPEDHLEVAARAEDYLRRAARWLAGAPSRGRADATDPHAVIAWFHMMIAVKTDRALRGVREAADGDEFAAEDAAGSAKVALLGIERSHAAWLALVERDAVSIAAAAPMIADLVFLGEGLERLVPAARTFVRPAFDEPDAVAQLEAGERPPTL